MSGLSDLKVKIKNQPHNLAWINDKERSVLKAMGGSGRTGPMGIPAYDWADGDPDEGYDPITPSDGQEGNDAAHGWSGDSIDSIFDDPDVNGKDDFSWDDLTGKDFETYEGIGGPGSRAAVDASLAGKGTEEEAEAEERSLKGIEAYKGDWGPDEEFNMPPLDYDPEKDTHISIDSDGKQTVKDAAGNDITDTRLGETVLFQADLDKRNLDATVKLGRDGHWSYTGPDAWKAFGQELSKGVQGIAGAGVDMIGGLATAYSMLSPLGLMGLLAGKGPFIDTLGIGPKAVADVKRGLSDLSKGWGKSVEDTATAVANFFGISKKDITEDHIESFHNNIGLAGGGQVYNNFIAQRRHGGRVDQHGTTWYAGPPAGSEEPEEDKSPSAMELYLEKLGQPSKYTIPTVPMDVPSMAPPPTSSDPFELAEYRKGLARETMGNYLPFDVGGASSALNTFNEDYYGGASQLSPYNIAQMGSLLGLPAGSQEGIIGMLGGVRNEPPPPPPLEIEPEPHYEPPYDDWWFEGRWEEAGSEDNAKHGGGIGHILQRQDGGMITHEGLQGFGMESPRPFGIAPFSGGLR